MRDRYMLVQHRMHIIKLPAHTEKNAQKRIQEEEAKKQQEEQRSKVPCDTLFVSRTPLTYIVRVSCITGPNCRVNPQQKVEEEEEDIAFDLGSDEDIAFEKSQGSKDHVPISTLPPSN